jgi:hypothetical protein
MSDREAQLLYDGALALRRGDRRRARELLLELVEINEEHAEGWLWLSGAVDDRADQQIALENVLALDPDNRAAQHGLRVLAEWAAGPTGG